MASESLPDEMIDPPPRFGVRAALIAMTVLALAAACSAPLVRDWEPERWGRLGVATLSTAVGAAIGAAFVAWRAKRALRKAGRHVVWLVRGDVGTPSKLSAEVAPVLPYVVIPALIVALPLFEALTVLRQAPRLENYILLPSIMGVSLGPLSWCLTRLRLARGVALGDGGLYLPDRCRYYKLSRLFLVAPASDSNDNRLRLSIGAPIDGGIYAVVPDEKRAAVETLLAEKLPPRGD